MNSDSSIRKFVTVLEPLVLDLEERKKELSLEKEKLENVSRFLAYTKDNYEIVGIYADQELITSYLDKIGYSIEEYKASCYLLKSEDESVKKLPQYDDACGLIGNIINYFSEYKIELTSKIQELNDICARKELEKKYYDILTNNKPYVKDIDEFKDIINGYDLTNDDKINIVVSVIKSNIENYESGNK